MKEYYSLSRTPRAQALGNAFYGLSDDEGAMFYNPAGLSLYTGGAQFLPITVAGAFSSEAPGALSEIRTALQGNPDTASVVGQIADLQGKIVSVEAGVFPHFAKRGFAVGLLLADVKGNFLLAGREIDSDLDVTGISDSGLFITKAWQMGKSPLHVGITAKLLGRVGGQKRFTVVDFIGQDALGLDDLGGFGAGADFDVGVVWSPKGTSGVGVSLNNVLATEFPWVRSGETPPPALARMVSLGVFTTTGALVWRADLSEIQLGGESDPELGHRGGSLFKHVNAGVEWKLSRGFQLRAGLHQGSVCAGFGVTAPFLRFDVATWGEELGLNPGTLSNRRFGLRLALGYVGTGR